MRRLEWQITSNVIFYVFNNIFLYIISLETKYKITSMMQNHYYFKAALRVWDYLRPKVYVMFYAANADLRNYRAIHIMFNEDIWKKNLQYLLSV